MFNALLYLVIALLMIAFSGEAKPLFFVGKPALAFAISLTLYALMVACIYFATSKAKPWIRKKKGPAFALLHLFLLGYLAFFLYLTEAKKILHLPFFIALASLSFYFGGLAAYHAGCYTRRYLFPGSEKETKRSYTLQQMRMWLPFTLPFLFFTLFYDLITLLPTNSWTAFLTAPEGSPAAIAFFFGTTILFMALLLIFLPYAIQKLWLCKEIEDRTLLHRLKEICRRANFRCGGLRTWTVMNNFHTAAIIGLIPSFRYVMFTKRLLFELPAECIEAILVHEIGHSYRNHLLIYPFILFGMFLTASLASLLTMQSSFQLLQLMEIIHPSPIWDILYPLLLLLTYIAIIALYFRIVFGFFSRLFERQADLHCYVVGTPAKNMIDALDQIAIVTGNSHEHPSWHHYSIRERITFLEKVEKNRALFDKHNRRVKRWIATYFLIFAIGSTILLSTALGEYPPFAAIKRSIDSASDAIKDKISTPIAKRAAASLRERYGLRGDSTAIDEALVLSFSNYLRYYDIGLVDYSAAERLHAKGENKAAMQLMSLFWNKISPDMLTKPALFQAKKFTENLLSDPDGEDEREELSKSYQQSLAKSQGVKR